MRGIFLAVTVSAAYAFLLCIVFRSFNLKYRAAMMLRIYLVSLLPFSLMLTVVPYDLGFLPKCLIEQNIWLDSLFALVIYSASVFGGWLQLYNLADRGLSLHILIDAMESQDGVSALSLSRNYGKGKGIQWMYEKRLADIERLGLVTRNESGIVLSKKGIRNSKFIIQIRRFYAIASTRNLG